MADRRQQSKLLSILIGICIFLIIAVLILVYGKDLIYKRYTNRTAGITLKYPADWTFNENLPQADAVVIFFSPKDNAMDFFQENFNVVKQNVPAAMSMTDYSQTAIKQVEAVFKGAINVLSNEDIEISGIPAHKFEYIVKDPKMSFYILHVWLITDDSAFQFTFTSLESQYAKYLPKVQNMVNSLKPL